ncbi:MAG: hypothetical protein IT551_05580 [Novosphingobium sp.]|jgi:hypothetical protein|nr:hypothetical protein [Novosphingobium sp.]
MSGRDISAADYAVAITPSDVTVLPYPRGLYVGVSGDVAVVMKGKSGAVVFKGAPVGILPIRPAQVLATGTTATDILALY